MKRNFNTVINSLDGEPFEIEPAINKIENGKTTVETPAVLLTLKRVALDAIGANLDSDHSMSGEEKFYLFNLASRIVEGFNKKAPVELDEKDLTTLKTRIGKTWGVFVAGPAFQILNTDYTESVN
jgi:hypothetical protein